MIDLANTTEMTEATQIEMLPILTVRPDEVKSPMLLIFNSKRETKGTTVKTEDRFRGVLVPEAAFSVDGASSKFAAFIQSSLLELAKDVLRSYLEAEPMARAIPAAKLNTNAILAYFAEEKQRNTIDGAAILAWLQASATIKTLNEQQKAAWTSILPKLAAPSFRAVLRVEQAARVVNQINEADMEHPACVFVLRRLDSIMTGGNLADAL